MDEVAKQVAEDLLGCGIRRLGAIAWRCLDDEITHTFGQDFDSLEYAKACTTFASVMKGTK